MIATNTAPGIYRKDFAFERWNDYDEELFDKLYNDDSMEKTFEYKIFGSDISPKAIAIAERNIKSAGMSKYIDLKVLPFQRYEEAPESGILVTNPPYGERISSQDLLGLYEMIGERLKPLLLFNLATTCCSSADKSKKLRQSPIYFLFSNFLSLMIHCSKNFMIT